MDCLDRSTIIRAGQRPAVIAYIPINVFIAECIVGLSLFWLLGVWAAAFFPVHFWFVIKTAEDYHWVAATWATVEHTMFAWTGFLPRAVKNKHLHGKGVVTFSASPNRSGERNYADLDQ